MNCGLKNPSQIEDEKYDSDQIGPWTRWQGSLDADIMVVGQDWGSEAEFIAMKGIDRETNSTDKTLISLFEELGIEVNFQEENLRLFFTNAALCIREDGAQGGLNDEWMFNCRPFLKEQIGIVKPKVIIALGQKTFYAVLSSLNLPRKGRHNEKYSNIITEPVELGEMRIFPVYHPGAYGRISRKFEEQKKDWKKIAQLIR
jgi:DNA polymerase